MSEITLQMSKAELRSLLEEVVEEKLQDYLGDPDVGHGLRPDVEQRLLKQKAKVEAGERGISMADVVARLGLET